MYENNVIDLACNLRDRFWPKCFHLKFWNRLSLFICFTALPADLHFKWIYNNVTLLHLCNNFIYSVQNFASKYMYSQKRIFFLPSAYSYVKENGSSESSNASLLQRAIVDRGCKNWSRHVYVTRANKLKFFNHYYVTLSFLGGRVYFHCASVLRILVKYKVFILFMKCLK